TRRAYQRDRRRASAFRGERDPIRAPQPRSARHSAASAPTTSRPPAASIQPALDRRWSEAGGWSGVAIAAGAGGAGGAAEAGAGAGPPAAAMSAATRDASPQVVVS